MCQYLTSSMVYIGDNVLGSGTPFTLQKEDVKVIFIRLAHNCEQYSLLETKRFNEKYLIESKDTPE